MRILVSAAIVASMGLPAVAASKKETDCALQAKVVGTVQKARIARVKERKVIEAVEANATWPEKYNGVIPVVTPWIYEMKMKDVKEQDLAAAWKELCLAQK